MNLIYCESACVCHLLQRYQWFGKQTDIFYRLSDQKVFVDNRIPAVLFTSGITMNNNKTWDRTENLNLEVFRKRVLLMYHWIEKML